MNQDLLKRIRRTLSLLLLFCGFIATVFILHKAYLLEEWNTIAASLAVIVAIVTLYTSMKVTWKNEDEQEPDFLLNWDFKSNNVSNYITIKNIGGGSAYDVSIEWTKTLKNFNNESVSFGNIPTLSKNQQVKTLVSTISQTWANAKEYGKDNDNFTGLVKYKVTKKSRRYQRQEFCISLGHKRYRNGYEDLEQEFHDQGKKIVRQLEKINTSISKLEIRRDDDGNNVL